MGLIPDRETNVANRFETTLSTTMGATDLTANVVTTSGAPSSPCYLVIDPDDDAKVEVIYFDGTFTATTFVTSSTANRYLTGSAAGSGITHTSGAKVVCVPVAQLWTDVGDRIDADATAATQKATLTTKGDLYVATAASTPARLAVGTDGSLPVADSGASSGVAWRLPTTASVAADEGTTSTTYTDLLTTGPAVTVTVGASGMALVVVTASQYHNSTDVKGFMAFAVSGASTVAATDDDALAIRSNTAAFDQQASFAKIVTGLTAGSNTFTAKYRTPSGQANFRRRHIAVVPL